MTPRELVTAYYNNIANQDVLRQYLHPQMQVHWTGDRGYLEMSGDELLAMLRQFFSMNVSSRFVLTHIIEEGNRVAVRYEQYVTTLDDPETEKLYSRSMGFWRIKDEKMYFGYVSSYQAK